MCLNTLGHKCAEFNLGGNSIQPLYETNCSQYISPCPFRYSSLVKRLKKVSQLSEKMMGLKKILVLTVCGNFCKDVDII